MAGGALRPLQPGCCIGCTMTPLWWRKLHPRSNALPLKRCTSRLTRARSRADPRIMALSSALAALPDPTLPLAVELTLPLRAYWTGRAGDVLDELLALRATILIPSPSNAAFAAPRPAGRSLVANGEDDAQKVLPSHGYSPESRRLDVTGSPLAAAALARHDRVRSQHPLASVVALGPLAGPLTAAQDPLNWSATLEATAAAGGWLLRDVSTVTQWNVHAAAEVRAGFHLFRRWGLVERPGGPVILECEHPGCPNRPALEHLVTPVLTATDQDRRGSSHQIVGWPLADLLTSLTSLARRDPDSLRCQVPSCRYCEDSRRGGPYG